jgi:hypothetical protein
MYFSYLSDFALFDIFLFFLNRNVYKKLKKFLTIIFLNFLISHDLSFFPSIFSIFSLFFENFRGNKYHGDNEQTTGGKRRARIFYRGQRQRTVTRSDREIRQVKVGDTAKGSVRSHEREKSKKQVREVTG